MLAKIKSKMIQFFKNKHVQAISIIIATLFTLYFGLWMLAVYPAELFGLVFLAVILFCLYMFYKFLIHELTKLEEKRRRATRR